MISQILGITMIYKSRENPAFNYTNDMQKNLCRCQRRFTLHIIEGILDHSIAYEADQ